MSKKGIEEIKSIGDVRILLKQFGILIYTKDPIADLELMEEDLQELNEHGLVEKELYLKAILIIRAESQRLKRNLAASPNHEMGE